MDFETEVLKTFLGFMMFLLSIFQAVTLHTDLGELKIELFCERTPKACEVKFYAAFKRRRQEPHVTFELLSELYENGTAEFILLNK